MVCLLLRESPICLFEKRFHPLSCSQSCWLRETKVACLEIVLGLQTQPSVVLGLQTQPSVVLGCKALPLVVLGLQSLPSVALGSKAPSVVLFGFKKVLHKFRPEILLGYKTHIES